MSGKFFVFNIFLIFTLLVFSGMLFITPTLAAGKTLEGLNQSAEGGFGDKITADDSPMADLPTAAGRIVGVFLSFIGVIFFGLMIYGGFTWMLARGNEQEVSKAKNIIETAAIGLVIVLAAYAITAFIGGALLGTTG